MPNRYRDAIGIRYVPHSLIADDAPLPYFRKRFFAYENLPGAGIYNGVQAVNRFQYDTY